ncbi:hypothetical protein BDR04DRAFT_728760 [Suillus decipiens]|nr:hypothetical protein BDR04DRAFT_728760 [Suillus decipiens]
MQLSLLFSALVSLAILVTALPTPGAISKRSLESKKREELESNLVAYSQYTGDGGGSGISRAIEEREDLESNLVAYTGYAGDGGGSGISRG